MFNLQSSSHSLTPLQDSIPFDRAHLKRPRGCLCCRVTSRFTTSCYCVTLGSERFSRSVRKNLSGSITCQWDCRHPGFSILHNLRRSFLGQASLIQRQYQQKWFWPNVAQTISETRETAEKQHDVSPTCSHEILMLAVSRFPVAFPIYCSFTSLFGNSNMNLTTAVCQQPWVCVHVYVLIARVLLVLEPHSLCLSNYTLYPCACLSKLSDLSSYALLGP